MTRHDKARSARSEGERVERRAYALWVANGQPAGGLGQYRSAAADLVAAESGGGREDLERLVPAPSAPAARPAPADSAEPDVYGEPRGPRPQAIRRLSKAQIEQRARRDETSTPSRRPPSGRFAPTAAEAHRVGFFGGVEHSREAGDGDDAADPPAWTRAAHPDDTPGGQAAPEGPDASDPARRGAVGPASSSKDRLP